MLSHRCAALHHRGYSRAIECLRRRLLPQHFEACGRFLACCIVSDRFSRENAHQTTEQQRITSKASVAHKNTPFISHVSTSITSQTHQETIASWQRYEYPPHWIFNLRVCNRGFER